MATQDEKRKRFSLHIHKRIFGKDKKYPAKCRIFLRNIRNRAGHFLSGGIAQLGEHLLCKQGVIGSIPIISTSVGQRFEKAFVSGNDSAKQRCKAGQKRAHSSGG